LIFFLLIFLHLLLILLTVAFFTLFERKIIGRFHIRLGPVKLRFLGLLQPLIDALKLFGKERFSPFLRGFFIFHKIPILSLQVSLMIFIILPWSYIKLVSNFSLLVFILLRTFIILAILFNRWSSNSKYALIGGLRGISQAISYEAIFSTLLILIFFLSIRISYYGIFSIRNIFYLLIFPLWGICSLGETQRAPFDFSEAESELVSGFNTEFRSASFAFLFLREYIILLFNCLVIRLLFFSGLFTFYFSNLNILLFAIFLMFLSIWIRITFCRYRYDILINLAWKTLLPITLIIFILSINL